MALRAGVAVVNITPPIGIWMTGFAARPGPANGVHDELYARAVVVESGGAKVALVALDIIQPDEAIVSRVRFTVEQWTGIPTENILLNSSHTHSGPSTYRFNGMGNYDEAYCDVLGRKIATAIKLAADQLQPARLRFGKEHVAIGHNRRQRRANGSIGMGENTEGAYDPTVYVIRFDFDHRGPVVILSHAAHPVILGGGNLDFSADFCSYACRSVEEGLGDDSMAMFFQGCCGNINADRGDGSFEQAAKMGNKLGAAALNAAMNSESVSGETIGAALEVVQLPLVDPPSVEEAEETLRQFQETHEKAVAGGSHVNITIQEGLTNWASRVLACAKEGKKERTQTIILQSVRLGDIGIAASEAETFIEIGQAIQERSPFEHTIALGYTNGCIGYLPTAAAYPEGGYEVATAIRYYGLLMMSPESERIVVDRSTRLLEQVRS